MQRPGKSCPSFGSHLLHTDLTGHIFPDGSYLGACVPFFWGASRQLKRLFLFSYLLCLFPFSVVWLISWEKKCVSPPVERLTFQQRPSVLTKRKQE